jgi:hypothetical protein
VSATRIQIGLVLVLGFVETLLLGRLAALLLAARPDNPAVALLLRLSAPLAAPLSGLDAGQPQFGSRFERGTLVCIVILPLLGYLLWRLVPGPAQEEGDHERRGLS